MPFLDAAKTHVQTLPVGSVERRILEFLLTHAVGRNKEGRGYFLIQDREDADVMRRWYARRIQVEKGHLDRLVLLIHEHFEKGT